MKASQKASAAQARAAAAQARAAETASTLEAAVRATPYFRDLSARPGARVATLEPWPPAPEGDDAALERWWRKVVAADRRLGLWTGYMESKIGRTRARPAEWAWVTEGAEEALDGANVVIELRWVRAYTEGAFPDDQPIDAYAGSVLIGSLVEDDLEATLKRRRSAGKPTFVRGVLSHYVGPRVQYWTVSLPGIPEPPE